MSITLLRTIVGALVVVAVSFVVFVGTVNYEYVNWDDDIYIRDNEMIHSLSFENIGGWFTDSYYYSYIPLTLFSYAVDYSVWQESPRGYHLTNVILHSLNAGWLVLLGFVLLQRGRRSEAPGSNGVVSSEQWNATLFGAIAGALFFALHPLRAESVAWISDRKDLLCVFFLLPAVLFYLRYSRLRGEEGSMKILWFSFFLFLLAALSKTIAVAFPVILLLIDWLHQRKSGILKLPEIHVAEKIPFLVAAAALAVVALLISPDGKQAYSVEQLQGLDVILFPFYSFGFYIWKTLFPLDLSPIYPSVQTGLLVLSAGLFILVAAGCVYAAMRGKREFLAAWFVYLSLLLPTVVGLSSGMQPQADRFAYVSTIPLFLLLSGGFSAMWMLFSRRKRVMLVVVVLAALTVMTVHTVRTTRHWESSRSLWSYVVENFPPKPDYIDAYTNLGQYYANGWELPEAEEVLNKAIEIDSTSKDAFYNLAHVLYFRGDWEEAAALFKKSTDLDSTYAKGFFNYAIVSSQLGRDDLAIPAMRRAARLGMQEAKDALLEAGISPDSLHETTIPLERK